jgi:hypothetical protein
MAAVWAAPDLLPLLARATAVASLVHVLIVAGELGWAHPTAHAELAARNMIHGRYASAFRSALVLMSAGAFAVWLGAFAAPLALAGLLAYEHAYIQAGQSVPLA